MIGKFIDGSEDSVARAEQAIRRALELDPRLSMAHRFYANLEADTGKPREAMARLLGEASRNANDAELFAGLAHALRYCGLYEQSIAADKEARRLDPNAASSLDQTILMTGDIERMLAHDMSPEVLGNDSVVRVIGLGLAGRYDEARPLLLATRDAATVEAFRAYAQTLLDWLDRNGSALVETAAKLASLKIMEDPEAHSRSAGCSATSASTRAGSSC